MSLKNISILSLVGGLLLVFTAAGVILSGMFFAPAAVVAMYIPEALSEVE